MFERTFRRNRGLLRYVVGRYLDGWPLAAALPGLSRCHGDGACGNQW
jgi:hypothetical protein